MDSFQDGKYGSSPTSSSSSSIGAGPFNSSLGSRTGTITDPSFPYFPPPFNPAFAAQFDVHAAAAASAIEHYPSFNYAAAAAANGSSTSSSPYGTPSAIHHQHAGPSSFNNTSYDPYASAYVAVRHHSILDAHHHHHPAAELYARHNPHHQTSANSLVDHTARVSEEDLKSLDLVHRTRRRNREKGESNTDFKWICECIDMEQISL